MNQERMWIAGRCRGGTVLAELLLPLWMACGHRDTGTVRLAPVAVQEVERQANADHVVGRVVGVHDGDTLTVLDASRVQHKIRLMGIDAPELKQAFGRASKQHLSEACFGREVAVEVRKRDRYGRDLGRVQAQGLDLNLEQIRAGLAWHYRAFARDQTPEHRKTYAAAEEEARRARRGLWADAEPRPPWDYRRDPEGHTRKVLIPTRNP